MKISVTDRPPEPPKYPMLLESVHYDGRVVLALEAPNEKGVFIGVQITACTIELDREWNFDSFKPFDGIITLQND